MRSQRALRLDVGAAGAVPVVAIASGEEGTHFMSEDPVSKSRAQALSQHEVQGAGLRKQERRCGGRGAGLRGTGGHVHWRPAGDTPVGR